MEIKQSIWNLSGTLIASLIGILSLPFLTKYLDLYDYGIYALSLTFSNFVVGMAHNSLGFLLQEKYIFVTKKEKFKIRSLLLYKTIKNTILFSAVLIIICSIVKFLTLNKFEFLLGPIFICILGSVFNSTSLVSIDICALSYRSKNIFFIQTIKALFHFLICLLILRYPINRYLVLPIGYFFSSLIIFIYSLNILSPFDLRIHDAEYEADIKRKFKYPITAGFLNQALLLIEKNFIIFILGPAQLGILQHAQTYKQYSMTVMNSISLSFNPLFLKNTQLDNLNLNSISKYWRIAQTFLSNSLVLFLIFGKEIINFLTNNKFTEAYPISVILLLSLFINSLAKSNSLSNISNQKAEINTKASISGSVLKYILIFSLIPKIGISGSALADLFSTIFSRIILVLINPFKSFINYRNALPKIVFLFMAFYFVLNSFFILSLSSKIFIYFVFISILFYLNRQFIKVIFSKFKNKLS